MYEYASPRKQSRFAFQRNRTWGASTAWPTWQTLCCCYLGWIGCFEISTPPPPDCSNIETYVRDVVKPYIESYFLRGYRRIDLIFDFYLPDSLKKEIRMSRGTGKAIMVELSTKRPGDWHGFLSVDSNKLALFELTVRYLIEHLHVPEVCTQQPHLTHQYLHNHFSIHFYIYRFRLLLYYCTCICRAVYSLGQ